MTNKIISDYSAAPGGVQISDQFLIQRGEAYYSLTAEALAAYIGGAAPNVFYPEMFGGEGDAVGGPDGVVAGSGFDQFSSVMHPFTQLSVGKILFFDVTIRTITAVDVNGVATFTPANSQAGTGFNWVSGTDDTVAVQAALDAARDVQGSDIAETAGSLNGLVPSGGICELAAGRAYIISNSEDSFNAGKLSALQMARRTDFRGAGLSFSRSSLVLAAGSYGHMVANHDTSAGANSFTDFLGFGNMTLYGYLDYNPNGLDGFHLAIAFDGYDTVDPLNRIYNVEVSRCKQDGFYFQGRGEMVVQNCMSAGNGQYGYDFLSQVDYHVIECNAGGNQKSGYRIHSSGNGHYTNCKSYYSGSAGGTDPLDCANWALDSDQPRNGQCYFVNCEGQESRGSSWVINSGLNIFSACVGLDPGRETDNLDEPPLPDVRSGFHIMRNGCQNTFSACLVSPSVVLFNDGDNWGNGTNAVTIDDVDSFGYGPQENRGTIFTFVPMIKNGGAPDVGIDYPEGCGPVGGGGATNGRNYNLYVNNIKLPNTGPAAPYQMTAQPILAGCTLNWSMLFTSGLPITDYVVQYKLHSSGTWLTFSHSAITAGPITVTGLTNNSVYDFRVAGVNSAGQGPYAEIDSVTIIVTAPAQVTGVVATSGSGFVAVTWTAPADGNSPITDYFVEYKLTSSGTWLTLGHTASATTAQYLIDVTAASYDFRVSAINAVGTGAVSSVVSATPTMALLDFDASITGNITQSGGLVSSFADASGHGYTAAQATGSKQPVTGTTTINGHNAITYDGVDDFLKMELASATGFLAGLANVAVFSAFKYIRGNATGFSFYTNSATDRLIENGVNATGVYGLGKLSASGKQFVMQGTPVITGGTNIVMGMRMVGGANSEMISAAATNSPATDTTGTGTFTVVTDQSIFLGSLKSDFSFLNCARGQDIIFGGVLTDADMAGLGNAMAYKWGSTWPSI